MQIIDKIIEEIFKANTICIISHDGPDADAIGSSLALESALLQLNKKAKFILQTHPSDSFKTLLGDRTKRVLKKNEVFDLVFILDCSSFDRIKSLNIKSLSDNIITIDHHISNEHEGLICWREVVPSTGVLIYQLLRKLESCSTFTINAFIATNLLMSIRGDTDNFTISFDNYDIYRIASELMAYHADVTLINEMEKYNLSLVKLMGKTLNKLIFNPFSQIAYLIITKEEIELCGASFNDASHIIDLLKNIKDIKVTYLILQNRNKLSIKARSNIINVNDIMQEFGGGGHASAAGISDFYCKDIYQFINSLIKKTEQKMQLSSGYILTH